ncbi:50S ribosomal protein L25 [Candidatus Microgenomates bacterium]|nr:50S ribosomal protein L25 [Candidatus Microgenomates bacterium]
MKRAKLTVEKRTILGKKVKKLRREGILPANIYGKDIKSLAVQLKDKEFETVFKEAGETGLVDVAVNGEVKPVLIHNVQVEPLSNQYLHADFYQVNLKEKIKAMVPVVAVGEAKAVIDKVGIILQPLSEIEVEALPEDLPEKIEVNVEKLANLDEQIAVGDLKAPEGVEILTDPSQVVVKIAALVSKEAEELAAQEAAAAEAAKVASDATKAEAAPAEGVTEAEGAQPPAEGESKPETEVKPSTTETQKEEVKKEEK